MSTKSSVIKYVYNMYQANALSDNNSPTLALLAKKTLRLYSTNHIFH